MDITPITISPDCVGDVSLSAGVVSVVLKENTPGLQGSVNLQLPLNYFVDALVVKFGNTPTEQAIASILKAAIASIV